MKKFITILFFILLLVPSLLFYCILDQNDFSYIEQRNLQQIPNFSIDNFIATNYQTDLENSIADQMIISEKLKKVYYNSIYKISTKVIDTFDIFLDLSNKYVNIKADYYLYGDSNYFITKKQDITEENIQHYIDLYNNIGYPGVGKYIYFINKDSSNNFSSNQYNSYNEIIKENFEADYYGFFNINSFDEYKKYFYQTDHHWNYLGSYKGYTEIIRLLLGEDEKLIEPISVKQYEYIFNGSRSRQTSTLTSKEFFTVYEFPKLSYTRYNTETQLSEKNFYLEQGREYENYYASYYGSHWFEMTYDFNQQNKENLLVIDNSYTYPIDDLIASHFNKTYYLDIRYNSELYTKEFFKKYIDEKDIDKVLIIGDIYSFVNV